MADGRLREGARVREQRRHALLTARGMAAVDDAGERVERDVLGEGEPHRERARFGAAPPLHLVKREAEQRSVHRVECEADCAPVAPSCDRLSQQGDVGVVAAEQAPVDGLQQAPGERRDGAGSGRAGAIRDEGSGYAAIVCPRATLSTGRRAGSRSSSASGWRSRRRIRALR